MKKIGCLNSELSYVISKLGHFDTLTIGDCGLPVPKGVQRIDLAVTYGVPSFDDVFKVVDEVSHQAWEDDNHGNWTKIEMGCQVCSKKGVNDFWIVHDPEEDKS